MPKFVIGQLIELVELTENAGSAVVRALEEYSGQGRVVWEDVVDPGELDLGSILGSLEDIQAVQVITDAPSGFTIDVDGVGTSTLAFKALAFQMSQPQAGSFDVKLTFVEQATVKLVAIGDPLGSEGGTQPAGAAPAAAQLEVLIGADGLPNGPHGITEDSLIDVGDVEQTDTDGGFTVHESIELTIRNAAGATGDLTITSVAFTPNNGFGTGGIDPVSFTTPKAPGASQSITLRLTTDVALSTTFDFDVVVTTNDPEYPVMTFRVQGTFTASVV